MRHFLPYCMAAFLFTAPQALADDLHSGTVITVRPPSAVATKQGVSQFVGISGNTAGAKGISMNKVIIPAGGSAEAHTHSDYESAIYLMQGRVQTNFGKDLKESVINEAGDFIFIPAGVLHQPVNLSKTEPAIAIVSRNDPDEQEHVILHDPQQKH